MADSWTVGHQPNCGACGLIFSAVETLHQHLNGVGPCGAAFETKGCQHCLLFFGTLVARDRHSTVCKCAPPSISTKPGSSPDWATGGSSPLSVLEAMFPEPFEKNRSRAVAIACEMVGGGLDGNVDIAARVCILDDQESVLLHTVVRPSLPVTTYRDSRISPQELEQGALFKSVRRQVLSILNSSEATTADPLPVASKRPLLLGHDLPQHLECLMIDYPEHLRRDTALYPPLLSSTGNANTLNALAHAHLRWEIDSGKGGPRDLRKEALAVLRIYRLFCSSPPGHKHETLHERKHFTSSENGEELPSVGQPGDGNASLRPADAVAGPGLLVTSTQLLQRVAEAGDERPPPCWCLDECPAEARMVSVS